MNERLQGYTVHIGGLDVHPFSCSVDLKEVVIGQDAHPDPPIVHVPELSASVQWRALLSGKVVADVKVERPAVHVNLTQLRQEARDAVPVQERGWQEAVQAVFPLQINALRVVDGEVTYIDANPGGRCVSASCTCTPGTSVTSSWPREPIRLTFRSTRC